MAANIDPLSEWRIVIKAMGGAVGNGSMQLSFTEPTNIYSLTPEGIIDSSMLPGSRHEQAPAGGPYTVVRAIIPFDPVYETGGTFWLLQSGPYAGWYVSAWSNTLSDDFGPYGGIETEAGFDRGPGATLGTIYKPAAHLSGASINYNAPGELHFTLLVDDPYIGLPVPKETHYAVEIEENGSWVERFSGLIWDVDATETEAVFYGIDYLGLYQYVVDERFDPDEPEVPVPVGSKYVNKDMRQIVTLALTYARDKTDSPVGFIKIGDIPLAMRDAGKIDAIYSTLTNVLDFVVGIIQSHREGSGIYTRISVVNDGGWKVVVENDPGEWREDLTLEYGELAQGYRIMKFGPQWATRANVVARDRDGIKVSFKTEVGGASETKYGNINMAAAIVETKDKKDLQRRAKQMAMDAAAMPRKIGVGLKLGSWSPLWEFNICDTIQVDIAHGAVDTMTWNPNGYWVIVGCSWETYDDGHWITNVSLIPDHIQGGCGCS